MNLNYRISGPSDAPALVLAHSLATNHQMWDLVLPLLESDYRVIRYDARGHGGTSVHSATCSMSDLQDDVLALLDHLDLERVYFAGLSMGGMVGLGLGLDHPDRLLGLVICNTRAQTPASSHASWNDRMAQVRAGGIDVLIDSTLKRWFTETFQADSSSMDWMRSVMRTTSAEGYSCCVSAIQNFDLDSRLGEMRVPTLYLTGEQDAGAPPEAVKELSECTPGSAFVSIAGAAHLSAVEQPVAVGTAITEFLKASTGIPARR